MIRLKGIDGKAILLFLETPGTKVQIMLVISVYGFGEFLVATLPLELSSGNSHPHGKLLKETNFEKFITKCTDTTAVNCCALEKDIIVQDPYRSRSPETVELDEVLMYLIVE